MGGNGHLDSIGIVHHKNGHERTVETPAVFSFIGAAPRTEWLPPEIARDAEGFIQTGVTATRQIKALLPETSIIGISAAPTPYAREEMLKAGARGFVQKEQIPDALLAAIEQAIRDRVLYL